MRLWIFSDLHQDRAGNAWDPARHAPADGFDVVIVAGDVHSPLTAAIDWLADRFVGCRVLYAPGNHDFWWDGGDDRYTLADQIARGRDLAARRGIDLLIDDSVVIDGARFAGATLWTDMRLGAFSAGPRLQYGAPLHERLSPHPAAPVGQAQIYPSRRHRRPASREPRLHRRRAGGAVRRAIRRRDAPCAASELPVDRNADLRWCYASDLSAT